MTNSDLVTRFFRESEYGNCMSTVDYVDGIRIFVKGVIIDVIEGRPKIFVSIADKDFTIYGDFNLADPECFEKIFDIIRTRTLPL